MHRKKPPEGVASEWFAQLQVEEYASVRAESIQSFQNTQSIIQWSLATYGVLFGAGLLALNQKVSGPAQAFVAYASLVIFMFLLPGLICAATWQWLGEITRMERTGVYLRGFETKVREAIAKGIPVPFSPLHWETFLAGGAKGRKRMAPYVGTAMMFGGSIGASLVFACLWYFSYFGSNAWLLPDVLWLCGGVAMLAVFVWVSLSMGISVLTLGTLRYDIDTGALVASR